MAKFQFIEWLLGWIEDQENFNFEWDAGNSTKSASKHGMSCQEAESVFELQDKIRFLGLQISPAVDEPRYGLFGSTTGGRLVFICFTLRGQSIRIISIRALNRKEVRAYEKLCEE